MASEMKHLTDRFPYKQVVRRLNVVTECCIVGNVGSSVVGAESEDNLASADSTWIFLFKPYMFQMLLRCGVKSLEYTFNFLLTCE